MWRRKEVRTNKVLVYYILAIVMPCIGLGLLAFRGIRNDQALVEREKQRRWEETGEELKQAIIYHTDSLVKAFSALNIEVPESGKEYFSRPDISQFIEQNPKLRAVFFMDTPENDISINHHDILYLSDETTISSEMRVSPSVTSALRESWRLEFQNKDYALALAHYSRILNRVTQRIDKATLLNVMARLYRKQGLTEKACDLYQQITEIGKGIHFQSDIPAGITAQRELIKLYLNQDKEQQASREIDTLIQMLGSGETLLKQAYFQNTLDDLNVYLKQIEESPTFLQGKREKLLDAEKWTQYVLQFQGSKEAITSHIKSSMTSRHRSFQRINGQDYFYSTIPFNRGIWILLYDDQIYFEHIVQPFLNNKALELGFTWRENNDGGENTTKAYSSASSQSYEYTFAKDLPLWKIQFQAKPHGTIASLFKTSKGVYLYIFLLTLIILFFGLYFTLFTVSQEIKLSRMKSFFISTVSHEFKSPITSIRQMAEMLDRNRISSPERKRKYYSTMLHESERLSHLVENILDFARMEQGRKQYRFEKGQIEETIAETVENFKVQSDHKEVQLAFTTDKDLPQTVFDREAIEQVIHNLLDNALKYGGQSNRIKVSVERSGGLINIRVQDWGMGITKEDQPKIFNRFYRVGDELTSRIKGSGIGLTIVRQIVEDHQGKISVRSKPGVGSTFTISIPIKHKV